MSDTRELFRALEFAHYAERFRGCVFVIALPPGAAFSELLLDLKVLAGYHIGVVLVMQDAAFTLEALIAQANKRGSRFQLNLLTDLLYQMGAAGGAQADPGLDFGRLAAALSAGRTPIIALHGSSAGETAAAATAALHPVYALSGQIAQRMGARKLFLVHPETEALRKALPRSAVQAADLPALSAKLGATPSEHGLRHLQPLTDFIGAQLGRDLPEGDLPGGGRSAGPMEVVLLEGRQGHLFTEVFTFDGSGVLFNASRSSRIRRAEPADVTDVALLLRPEVEADRIRPVTENQIEAEISHYRIYEIDGVTVGLARLKPYGEAAELAQFATLARYRGQGRARELAEALIAHAQEEGYRSVFALSTDPRMWAFFESLRFLAVERETLPARWRADYDMQRPSRAFLKDL